MPRSQPALRFWTSLGSTCLGLSVLLHSAGCTRTFYRKAADREVNFMVAQKSFDARWAFPGFTIAMDKRSRYYDPTNPDGPPMPYDDPASHMFMHCVDGKKHYPCWHMNGEWYGLESPYWRQLLGGYTEITKEGALKLTPETALKVAIINSTDYRTQIETIYLSALDVSTERFRFDVQFFGSTQTLFTHTGPFGNPAGGETNTLAQNSNLTLDKQFPTGGQQVIGINNSFATGGELIVGLANSIVWQFAGPDTNVATSLLSFNFVQPLLRAGGRAVALEQLTIVERTLLANLRAFQRYRQGFYTQVMVGDNTGVVGPQRRGGLLGGTGLTGFSGTGNGGLGTVGAVLGAGAFGGQQAPVAGTAGFGFAGGGAGSLAGFLGILQQLQQVRNSQDNLNAQLRTLGLLEANLQAGLIDITQVDLFRQNIQTERANLLAAQVQLHLQVDTFVSTIMDMAPDLPVEVDDSLIQKFQFIDPYTTVVQNLIDDFVSLVGELPLEPTEKDLANAIDSLEKLRDRVGGQFKTADDDLATLERNAAARAKNMSSKEVPTFRDERRKLTESLKEVQRRFDSTAATLNTLKAELPVQSRAQTTDKLVSLATQLSSLTQELSLVKARARVESVTIERMTLTPDKAIRIARVHRLDWMNNRAALVDNWRLITYNASFLKSGLNLTFSGDLGTIGNNGLAFNGQNGDLKVGLRFDAPFTRRLERNNYRSILITYQQSRRQLMTFQDQVNFTLRRLLRQLRQLDINLEIQRRAVVIAVRRVDQTREVLNAPPAPVEPGQQVVPFGPTAAQNLLTALSDLRNSQNAFMSVWLNHYATRMVLMRELGIMELNECGAWVDRPFKEEEWLTEDPCPMPPGVPGEWLEEMGVEAEKPQAEPTSTNLMEESWNPADGDSDGGGHVGKEAGTPAVVPPTMMRAREKLTPPPGAEPAPTLDPATPKASRLQTIERQARGVGRSVSRILQPRPFEAPAESTVLRAATRDRVPPPDSPSDDDAPVETAAPTSGPRLRG